MITFPGSPRLVRGALVAIELPNPVTSIIVFQFNPATMSRTLETQSVGDGGSIFETQRLKGAPVETISLDVEIDATDQLEKGEGGDGIYPQLSALEMLIYPQSALVVANSVMLGLGTLEVVPPTGPLILFVWGLKRVLPVRITDFSIAEEAYDANLNPIRATVSLGLRVMTYNDLPLTHPGYHLFLIHQVTKEVFATIGSVGNLDKLFSGNVALF
jgi:hypothetical protein